MAAVKAVDHALPDGNGSANPAAADPGGMTNDEKRAVSGVIAQDEQKGASVHVGPAVLRPLLRTALLGCRD